MQRHGPMVKLNWTSFYIFSRLYLWTSPSQTRVMEFIFFTTAYLQRYADAVAAKGTPLYNCFDFVHRTIAGICRPVFNERVVFSHHTRVYGVKKFQSVVLSNGLIINLEGQWEDLRHDCVLCFINLCFYMETMINQSMLICRPLIAKET